MTPDRRTSQACVSDEPRKCAGPVSKPLGQPSHAMWTAGSARLSPPPHYTGLVLRQHPRRPIAQTHCWDQQVSEGMIQCRGRNVRKEELSSLLTQGSSPPHFNT